MAQVLSGGRGLGTFKNGFKGGVHMVTRAEEAKEFAEQMLGQELVTKQAPNGIICEKVYLMERVYMRRELYVGERASGEERRRGATLRLMNSASRCSPISFLVAPTRCSKFSLRLMNSAERTTRSGATIIEQRFALRASLLVAREEASARQLASWLPLRGVRSFRSD